MCRYATPGPYRDHYACFACRKSFKWPHDPRVDPSKLPEPKCPDCGGPMEPMGLDFKAPPRDHLKQWKKARVLADHGFRYTSCGCSGPGLRPEEQRDVEAFLHEQLPEPEAQRVLQRIDEHARAHARAQEARG
jgi:hypothetical protein